MQGDRDRVQLGGLVVALPGRGAEERVQVAPGARDQVGVRGAGQGEVEQDQLAALAVERAQRQVVWLDVAMPDAPLVEEGDGLEQVLAEPLEFVDGERAVLAQFLGEGVLPDVLDADDGAAGVVPGRPGRAGRGGVRRASR